MTIRIKIRRYSRKDLPDIVRVCNESFRNVRSCWPNPLTAEWFEKRFEAALKSRNGAAYVAEHAGLPIGYVLLSKVDRPSVGLVALISGISVSPRFQRRGIGSRLMEKAFDWAKKQGAVLIENDDEIVENLGAVSFFEKLGFHVFHRGVFMSRNLEPAQSFVFPERITTRELKTKDLDQLLLVRRKSFEEFGPWYSKPDAEAFKKGMRDRIGREDVKVYVAEEDNALIGYVVCSVNDSDRDTGDIRVVCVVPEHRRKHVGTALIVDALDFLREQNIKTVCTVTETAEEFYTKVGFKVDATFVRVSKVLFRKGQRTSGKALWEAAERTSYR